MKLFQRLTGKANGRSASNGEKLRAEDDIPSEKAVDDSASTAPLLPDNIDSTFLSSLPTTRRLFTLTMGSPKAQACYEKDKKNIATAVISNELLPHQQALALALACLEAPSVRQGAEAKPAINKFLASLSDIDNHPMPPLKDRSMQEIDGLIRLHQTVATVADVFCAEAFANWPDPRRPTEKLESLSDTERSRLYRAFYRFELFCRVFSPQEPGGSYAISRQSDDVFDSQDHAEKFLAIFCPWEIEEMICIYDFALSQYGRMMHKVYDSKRHPARTGKEPYAEGTYDSDDSDDHYRESGMYYEDYLQCFASYGVEFLRTALDTSSNIKELRSHLGWDNRKVARRPLRSALEEGAQRTIFPPEHFARQFPETGSPMIFTSDEADKPNEGWTLANRNQMTYDYGEYSFESLRKWAYVMWDHQTLEQGQALDKIRQESVTPVKYWVNIG